MALTFNRDTGLTADETSTIRANIAQEWKNAFATDSSLPELDTNAETPAGQLIDGITALASEKDNEMIFLSNQFNPKNADGAWQNALASIYFIQRKIAQPTYVTCQATGLYGTVIPYGAIVQDTNGNTFMNTSVATINASGQATLYTRCTELGAIEVASGTVTKIITTVPGWDSVTNAASGVTGRDEESQAALESRRVQSVAKNAHGSVASLFGTIADINDVTALLILENTGNTDKTEKGVTIAGHSVFISVYGGNDEDIAKAIYNKLDAGCGTNGNTLVSYNPRSSDQDQPDAVYSYYIERPTATSTAVIVTISDPQTATLTNAIKQAVVENFNGNSEYRRVKMGDTLYASRFYNDVLKAGVTKLKSIKVQFPSGGSSVDSVSVDADVIPTISTSDVTVVYS